MGGISTHKKTGKAKLKDYVSWFEIPAVNFAQAVNFYNTIYQINMETNVTETHSVAYFPIKNGVGGAIVAGVGSVPSASGPLLYLNAGNDLNDVLGRIEEAGGRIVMQKTLISEDAGYFAIFIDSEGNKLALHSKN